MSEIDLTLALQLHAQFEEELRVSLLKQQEEEKKNEETPLFLDFHGKKKTSKHYGEPQQEKLSISLIDPTWELIDPNPEIHTLFLTFNDQFFWGRLSGIEVRWSPRMTLCAGVCCYEGRGGLCSVRLSLPLLKLRPRKDLLETLLHEMIHAYLFVTANNRDRDGHGPEFHKHMYRINGVAGTKITVFHTFHDEVDAYRQHIWQCNGPCRTRKPYFGLLKRSMNRAPGLRDPWWERHQQTCGGTYIKIKEPDRSGTAKKETKTSSKADGCGDIRKYTGFTGKSNSLGVTSKVARKGRHDPVGIIKNDDSSKENISVDNVMRKKMSEGEHDLSKSTEKQNKLRSFASTSSGAVSQIKVTGASHSNVHGYGSHSPTRKKQCVDNGIARKVSGSKSTGKNPGGSGATGLAVRGSSSQTVTVRGKTSTQTKIQVEEKSNELSQTPFQGHGHTLGAATGGASRLLSLCATSQFHSNSRPLSAVLHTQTDSETEVLSSADAKLDRRNGKSHSSVSSAEGNKTPKRQKSLDCYVVTPSSSQPIRTTVRCPVCDASMPEKKLNKHLDECIGNLSDEDMMQDKTKAASCTGMSSASEEVRCLEDTTINGNGRQLPKADPIVCLAGGEGEQYPCPVCGECWSPATINQHLDSHF